MDITLHLVDDLAQNCVCAEEACLQIRGDTSGLTPEELKRVWTLRNYGASNRLEYGEKPYDDQETLGYVLMPIQFRLADTEYDASDGRVWKCLECGRTVVIPYEQLVETGEPECCEEPMQMLPPGTKPEGLDEEEPNCTRDRQAPEAVDAAS